MMNMFSLLSATVLAIGLFQENVLVQAFQQPTSQLSRHGGGQPRTATTNKLHMLNVPVEAIAQDLTTMSLSSSLVVAAGQQYATSPEPIHTAFSVATFLPQPFWLLMILFPNASITKKIMGGLEIPLLCCLVHFLIVATSIVQQGSGVTAPLAEFNDVFDPAGDPQNAFMGMVSKYPNFVAEEWSHVLTWDLFIGRWIWLDGLRRDIFTAPAVLFANLIGPPGLLIHWITCTVTGKEIFEAAEKEEIENL